MEDKKIKTNAERQKDYRNKNFYRINSIVNSDAAMNLRLIASHQGITKKKVLETVIEKYFREMTSKMSESELDDLYSIFDL